MTELHPLIEAHNLITGERAQQHGDAKAQFQRIVEQWALYIWHKYGVSVPLCNEDYCWMMADLKKVRRMMSGGRDNIVDAAGYIGLIEECGG